MSTLVYTDGALREFWDDDTRTYKAWKADGSFEVGSPRPYTAQENAEADSSQATDVAESNKKTINQQAKTALANNRNFLAIPSPSNAQTLAQVKALTRQNNGIIRLLLDKLDGTD